MNISIENDNNDINTILNSNSYYTHICESDLHLPPVALSTGNWNEIILLVEYTSAVMTNAVKQPQPIVINTPRSSVYGFHLCFH